MNKFVLSAAVLAAMTSTAMSADLGVISQPAPAGYLAPTADWIGFYAGVFGGLTNGPFDFSAVPAGLPPALEISINGGGAIGGAQIGYDVQFDQFVIGAVADIGITNHRVSASISGGGAGAALDIESRLTYLGTVRARAGYAFDDVLAYVHGGLAYGRTESTASVGGVAVPTGLNNVDRFGYTIGAGVEFQVTENISLQTEYAFTGFNEQSILDIGPGAGNINQALNFHTVKAGINFRF